MRLTSQFPTDRAKCEEVAPQKAILIVVKDNVLILN